MKLFDKPIPRYVGITDFMSRQHALEMAKILAENTKVMKTPPVLMVGIMMSFKTLWDIPNKWMPIWPAKERLDNIFPEYDTPGVLNTLHYADFEDHSAWPTEQNLFQSLFRAMDFARNNLHAIQLDMTWPDPGHIANAVHATRRCIQVILQIGRKAFAEAENNPEVVVEMLGDYNEVIDGVLLDQSMGEGKLMQPAELIPYIDAIKRFHPKMHVAVAGGLGPDTISVLDPLLQVFPDLSIDAQGALRKNKNAMDPIDWFMASRYLIKASKTFVQFEQK